MSDQFDQPRPTVRRPMCSSLPRAMVALLCVAGAGRALAQPTFLLTRVVTEGDFTGGVGSITTVNNVAVNNSRGWLVEADTDHFDTNYDAIVIRSGGLFLQEGQPLTGLAIGALSSVDGFSLNSAGNTGANYFLRDTGSINNDSGLFFNDRMILQEGTISTAAAFSPGTPYIGFFDASINDSNRLLVIASVDDPAIATTVDRAMVTIDYVPSSGTYTEAVIYKEGDIPFGQTQVIVDFGTGPHQYALNNAGQSVYFADLAGDSASDGVFYLDASTILAQEGVTSPDDARVYSSLSSKAIHLNDNGDTVFRATLSGDTATNEVIIHKAFGAPETIFAQEGQVLASLAPHALAGFGTGPVLISNTGNVVWVADTNNPDTAADIAVMYNDQVVLQEGQQADGYTVTTIRSIDSGYRISPSGRFILIRCVLSGGTEAAVLAKVLPECPSDFNLDGFVDGIDYDSFNNAFEAGDMSADYNDDGFVDGIDYDQFNNDFEAGC